MGNVLYSYCQNEYTWKSGTGPRVSALLDSAMVTTLDVTLMKPGCEYGATSAICGAQRRTWSLGPIRQFVSARAHCRGNATTRVVSGAVYLLLRLRQGNWELPLS